jgi:H+/gluconate symporter-like permease
MEVFKGFFYFTKQKKGEKKMEEIFKTYTLEIIIAIITTILTTIAGLWIKHLYKKMNEKEEQAKKLAEEKIAEEKKKAEEKRKEYERLLEEDKVRT